jgi:hypothetical protein
VEIEAKVKTSSMVAHAQMRLRWMSDGNQIAGSMLGWRGANEKANGSPDWYR